MVQTIKVMTTKKKRKEYLCIGCGEPQDSIGIPLTMCDRCVKIVNNFMEAVATNDSETIGLIKHVATLNSEKYGGR